MNEKEFKALIEQVVRQEMANVVGMSKSYMYKEQIMQQVQQAVASQGDSIKSQEDFARIIDSEIENIKGDMNSTFEMISRTLKSVPFDIYLKASVK